MRRSILIFAVLQAADVLTTLVGFRLGAGESSPFVRMLVGGTSPLAGLVAAKAVAAILAAAVLLSGRKLRLVNLWFSFVVIWNIMIIGKAL